jgi:hypothetical protein
LQSFRDDVLIRRGPRVTWREFSEATGTMPSRLQQHYKEVAEREYYQTWKADFKRVEAMRDELVAELREQYPLAVATIVDLMQRIQRVDKEVDHINAKRQAGVADHLLGTELAARNMRRLERPHTSITSELKLPLLTNVNDYGYQLAWPPLPRPIQLEMPAG